MTAPTFDTLSYARRLKAGGVKEEEAETHAAAVRDAITDAAATKANITELKAFTTKLGVTLTAVGVGVTGLIAGLIVGLTAGLIIGSAFG